MIRRRVRFSGVAIVLVVAAVALGHSLALAQIANLTMHEVIEAITNPRGSGWHDGSGEEFADKCLRIFPPDHDWTESICGHVCQCHPSSGATYFRMLSMTCVL